MDNGQISFFDMAPETVDIAVSGVLNIVKATYKETITTNWRDLFEGYDELYGITFSSGIQFMEKVMDMFEHVEMIFGCEGVMSNDIAAIMSMETKSVEQLAKSKCAKRMAERMEAGNMVLSVSRDTRSHEKIYILRANDGRCRVITGSANMSASAFGGIQREDIICFDDMEAYTFYKVKFDDFQAQCSDNVNHQVILATKENEDFIRDNIAEVPLIKAIENNRMVILEPGEQANAEIEVLADVKGLEAELKPLLPKMKKDKGKIILSGDFKNALKRKHQSFVTEKKEKQKVLPKLHIDYELSKIYFNGKEMNLNPEREQIQSDLQIFTRYMSSHSLFYGDYKQSQKDFFAFMNWYFASPFMPYLRYLGSMTDDGVIPFPVFGILYGESNGSKSTFIKLLSKLMCGIQVPLNSGNDFTSTNIDNLKCGCEGLPINIDDLSKAQYDAHYEKVIKNDEWGIREKYINYPAVTISTNKIPSIKKDITKRVVSFYIGIQIEKEEGARNGKKINASMRRATTALYGEYARRMLGAIGKMAEDITGNLEDYFPDIFKVSSEILYDIFSEYADEIPDYVRKLSFSDYFGDKTIGKNAMNKIILAWENDRKNFKLDKKKNTLSYEYTDNTRTYELRYIQQELPSVLNAKVVGSSIVMDLDRANEVFEGRFRKKLFK